MARDDESASWTLLVLSDRSSGAVEVIDVQERGTASYSIEICCHMSRSCGIKRDIFSCDQEPAILVLCPAIAAGCEESAISRVLSTAPRRRATSRAPTGACFGKRATASASAATAY